MIYQPSDDSFLLEKEVRKCAKGKSVLDIGTGSGIQARAAFESGAEKVLAVDIDPEVVESLEDEKFEVLESDLFSNVEGRFDLIVFNPPYLPSDAREDDESALVTSGGKKGNEIIVRFLSEVVDYLEEDGRILLVVSSLTPLGKINKLVKKKRVVASKKVFMEELWVWGISKT